MINVLVTGAKGQLASCLKDLQKEYTSINCIYTDSNTLDITNYKQLELFFNNNTLQYCINCAAYTAVDLAEVEKDKAISVNKTGVHNLAELCSINNVVLIHISTDFVFDGNSNTPYFEDQATNPINVYGETKLLGENEIKSSTLRKFFILRTSWLYSEYGNNFMKTMLRLSDTKKEISVVSDQVGTPTYAKDLANFIFHIIDHQYNEYGLYHFSNEGSTSWFEFALTIFKITNKKVNVNPVTSLEYPTLAIRPKYSVLSKEKIKTTFNIDIPSWESSLKNAIENLNEKRSSNSN